MTSYLLVALLACGVIEHIHGLDDGISAEFAFDVQKRLLHMQFGVPSWRILGTTIGGTHSLAFGRISGSGIHRRFHRGEQIRLRIFGRGRLPPFLKLLVGQHIGGDHIQPTDQQTPVYDRKEKLIDRVANTRRSRRRSGNAIDPMAGLGTRRPYLSIETGPSYVAAACSAIAFKSAEPSLPSRFGSRLAVS